LDWSFRAFVAGQTVNGFGSMVATVALPLVAVQRLHASTFDVGLLEAVEWVPAVILGLPVGALVDRHWRRARTVMATANADQALCVATVPLTATTGTLTFRVLVLAALGAGCFATVFQTVYAPLVRSSVGSDDLLLATSRLQSGRSVARVSGPALGGALAQAVGAATTLAADAASYLVSLLSVFALRSPAAPPPAENAATVTAAIREGLASVRASSVLSTVVVASAIANLFLTGFGALEVVFLVRVVHVGAATIGVLFAVSGAGGLAGSLAATRISQRFGTAFVARCTLAITAPAGILISVTTPGAGLALFAAGGIVVGAGIALVSVTFLNLRLQCCPTDLQARVGATSRTLTSAAIPLGALAAGALGQAAGTRLALAIVAVGYVAFSVGLLRKPLRPTITPARPHQCETSE
jgi:predicted MFS family arabinose efflux permease